MISVIIPTLNASPFLPELLDVLNRQTVTDKEIIVIDSSSTDNTVEIAKSYGARTILIPKAEFDHGGTRNMAASMAEGEMLIFLTQDALPTDEHFIENLIMPLGKDNVVACYGRQLPRDNAIPPEKFARLFNYPSNASIKSKRDIPILGIKTFFFPSVCSSVTKEAFIEAGQFPDKTIMNEDVILAAKLILNDHKIAYASDAKVIHSHNYSPLEQFKRYFDIGVAFNRQNWILQLASAEGEGVKYIASEIIHLYKSGDWLWIPYIFAEALAKYTGYRLGLIENKLPLKFKKILSMHTHFWEARN